eukprot:gene11224-7795_t
MGQTSSYAATSVPRALRRLKLSEVEDENEVLRQCGYCRGDHQRSSSASSGHTAEEPPASSTGGGAAPPPFAMSASVGSLRYEEHTASPPDHALSLLTVEPTLGAGTHGSFSGFLPPAHPHHLCVQPPVTFGPLVKLDGATYTLDELRAAVPFLPEALHIDLNRFSLLYVLDADGDGRFSEDDITSFVEWAKATLPARVPSDSLNEALQAACALECFRRCRSAIQKRRQVKQQLYRPGPFSPFDLRPVASPTSSMLEAEEEAACRAALDSSSSSSSTFSESLQSFTSPTRCGEEDIAATIVNENRGRRMNRRHRRRAGASLSPTFAAGLTPPPATHRSAAAHGGADGSPSGSRATTLSTLAAVHLSSWYLRLLHVQEVDRRRDAALQRLRQRHMLDAALDPRQPTAAKMNGVPNGSLSFTSSMDPFEAYGTPSRLQGQGPAPFASPPASVHHSRVSSMTEDALVQETPQSYREMDASHRYSIHAVEELYFDLGVRDSYDLSLWAFCHLLDPVAVKRVEMGLDLSPEAAILELRTATALEEARRRKARQLMDERDEQLARGHERQLVPPPPPPFLTGLQQQQQQQSTAAGLEDSVCKSTSSTDDIQESFVTRMMHGAGIGAVASAGEPPLPTASPLSPCVMPLTSAPTPTPLPAASTPHRQAGGVEAAAAAARRLPPTPAGPLKGQAPATGMGMGVGPSGVPTFSISHTILQPFVVCFVTSYWEMLRELRQDLFLIVLRVATAADLNASLPQRNRGRSGDLCIVVPLARKSQRSRRSASCGEGSTSARKNLGLRSGRERGKKQKGSKRKIQTTTNNINKRKENSKEQLTRNSSETTNSLPSPHDLRQKRKMNQIKTTTALSSSTRTRDHFLDHLDALRLKRPKIKSGRYPHITLFSLSVSLPSHPLCVSPDMSAPVADAAQSQEPGTPPAPLNPHQAGVCPVKAEFLEPAPPKVLLDATQRTRGMNKGAERQRSELVAGTLRPTLEGEINFFAGEALVAIKRALKQAKANQGAKGHKTALHNSKDDTAATAMTEAAPAPTATEATGEGGTAPPSSTDAAAAAAPLLGVKRGRDEDQSPAPQGAAPATAVEVDVGGPTKSDGPDASQLAAYALRSEERLRDIVAAQAKHRGLFTNKIVLAPLTTVGNLPFRRICKEFGADITMSEMAVVYNLNRTQKNEWSLLRRHESEDIFGIQLAVSNPYEATQFATALEASGFSYDFLDINGGCPIDAMNRNGCGCALMERLSIKCRIGADEAYPTLHREISSFESYGASAVTIHGRSRKQRYTKLANWDYVERCAAATALPVVGNGDILGWEDVAAHREACPHVTSFMIGRGALIKPWIFDEIKSGQVKDLSGSERFAVLQRFCHGSLFFHRYVPAALLERLPQKMNERPPYYRGRDEVETMMCSASVSDWLALSELLLGKVEPNFRFTPKHKSNSYATVGATVDENTSEG